MCAVSIVNQVQCSDQHRPKCYHIADISRYELFDLLFKVSLELHLSLLLNRVWCLILKLENRLTELLYLLFVLLFIIDSLRWLLFKAYSLVVLHLHLAMVEYLSDQCPQDVHKPLVELDHDVVLLKYLVFFLHKALMSVHELIDVVHDLKMGLYTDEEV